MKIRRYFFISGLLLFFFTASAQVFQTPFFQKREILTDYPNTTGLVALWRLDESPLCQTKIVYDYLGNHNGTVTTGTACPTNMSITGQKFRAGDFSGGNYYASVPTSSAFDRGSSSTYTILGWFNRKATSSVTDICWLSFAFSGGNWCPGIITSGGKITFWDGTTWNTYTTTLTASTWYHYAATVNGTTMKMYFNGLPVKTATISSPTQTNTGVYIADDNNQAKFPKIALDEVSVWNRVMSDSEIQTIYTNQAFTTANNIVVNTLKVFNITTNSFQVSVNGYGDVNNNSSVVFWYCDNTASPGCTPTSGNSITLTRSGNLFSGSVSGLSSPYNPGDFLNIQLVATDADGVSGSPITDTMRLTPNPTWANIYRSVGVGATTALVSGSGANTLSVSGTTATFSAALATNIGVGDAIQYDPVADSTTPTQIMFISGRTSSTVYTVLTNAGATPVATSTNLQNWKIFRAYTNLKNVFTATENTGIAVGVRSFDTATPNLTAAGANQRWFVAVYAGATAETSAVTITGWTTDIDHYIQVYTPYLSSEVGVSQRHAGVWDATKYRVSLSDTNGANCKILCLKNGYVRIIGLQFENTATTSQSDVISYNSTSSGDQYFASNIVRMGASGSVNRYCVNISSIPSNASVYIYNNIIYNCGDGIRSEASASTNITFNIYNNTIYNAADVGLGFSDNTPGTGLVFNIANNIAYNCGQGYYTNNNGSTVFNASNTYTSDGLQSTTQVTLSFVNTAGGDFHLAGTDTSVMGVATDLSTPNIESHFKFSDDIDTQTRPSGLWDVGADQH